jgi:ATP/maltotriose-dependent transcriptional regulator MalT
MSDTGGFQGENAKPTATDLADQALAAGKQVKDAAAEAAQATVETVKRQAADAARKIANEAGERLQDEAAGRKDQAADYVGRLAEAMRRAAREFESDLPIAASSIRIAATQVESASASMRGGNLKDLVEGAQSFARAQPMAFLGLTALAGFGLVRFLKSSGQAVPRSEPVSPKPFDYH